MPDGERVKACERVRSTLVIGSLLALRARGHGDAYAARIPELMLEKISSIGVPQWLPMEVAEAHYAACDALKLGVEEMLEIGGAVAPTAASGVSIILSAARSTGATPWTILERAPTYWKRMYDGGALVIEKKGPKDAMIDVRANALARYAYWRVGFRGIIVALARGLSTSALAREVAPRGSTPDAPPDAVTYALSWV